ncbi:sensor histidine kinase [Plantactinospora solaniradicis]|uniref:histidine kinase n=1 Tax=Plantactinospora solaniradicis TaxID=1723736 RepID=A0ABW1KBB2_9ACTN
MPNPLRSGWDEPRPPHPPRRVWRDWALVAVLVPVAVLEGVLRPDVPWRVLSVIVAVGLVPTLLWRRTRPLPMVAIAFGTCGLAALVVGADVQLDVMVYLLLLAYSLFRWGSGRDVVLGSAIILARMGLSIALGSLSLADAVGGFAVLFSVTALGAAFRYRARSRSRELDQVKLLERERLARDLHDTVAHHVSAMAIRAQAGLATSTSQPGAATDALRVIEAEASRALTEMRAMVRVLRRDQPADRMPNPRVCDLEQLAGRSSSGPSVEVELVGDLDDLPPPVDTAIYRLAQESITNARRHARHATRIEVRVTADDTAVRLRVSDDGDTASVRPTASRGYGLLGMIERADLLGGTCEAGPNPGRGWTVTAVLPRTGSAG